jgi:hypothetical protein
MLCCFLVPRLKPFKWLELRLIAIGKCYLISFCSIGIRMINAGRKDEVCLCSKIGLTLSGIQLCGISLILLYRK